MIFGASLTGQRVLEQEQGFSDIRGKNTHTHIFGVCRLKASTVQESIVQAAILATLEAHDWYHETLKVFRS